MDREVRIENPQDIEKTLNELRQSALIGVNRGMPPLRATMLNLIAYARTPERAREMAGQVAILAEHHPSRAIFISVDPGLPADEWEISVSTHCHPTIPGRIVCFEAVQVTAGNLALERVPAIALSALLRDLPVILWWPAEAAIDTPLFDRLLSSADQLIVDSALTANPEELLANLAGLGSAEHCQCALSDLNWDRLTPWRDLTAQFFDPPDCWPCLERIERVRIEYLDQDGSIPSQVHLLVAWLATRLGWSPASKAWGKAPSGEFISLMRGRQPVVVDLVPLPSCPTAASCEMNASMEIQRLTIQCGHPEGQAIFDIRRSADSAYAEVTTRLPARQALERTVALPLATVSDLLDEEFRRFGYDPIYQDALRFAAFLAAKRRPHKQDSS